MEWKWNIIRHTNDLIVIRLLNTTTNNFVRWNDIFENFNKKIFIIKVL